MSERKGLRRGTVEGVGKKQGNKKENVGGKKGRK